MQLTNLATTEFPIDGLRIEIYSADNKTGVCMVDTDADEVVSARRFDVPELAWKYYNELVRKCILAGDK